MFICKYITSMAADFIFYDKIDHHTALNFWQVDLPKNFLFFIRDSDDNKYMQTGIS